MTSTHERECVVCTNEFTTPKILPCGHLLCRQCVISWMDSKRDAGCPLCRCPIIEQSDGSSSDTVDALPTDFVMEALVESARVLSKDHLCCVCEDVRADFICMQCQDMLCTACAKVHKKMSITRTHDVESVSTVTPERLAASRPALCADHGDKHADSFCFCHRLAVCKVCKVQKHRECSKVSDFDCEIQLSENSLTDLTKILVEAEQKQEQVIGQLTSCLQEVDVSEQEDMAHVDTTCDRLQKLVEDFRMRLKAKTGTSHLQIRNLLRDVKSDLSNRLGKVTSHKHIVTRVTAVSPRPALIPMTQALTDRVNSLDLSVDLKQVVWLKPLSSVKCCEEVVGRIEDVLHVVEQLTTESKLSLPRWSFKGEEAIKSSQRTAERPVLVFHENCGTNIRLLPGNTTAENVQCNNTFNRVVVSRDVMVENFLYEVNVDAASAEYNVLLVGVTSIPPSRLVVTPKSKDLAHSIIIGLYSVYHQGTRVSHELGNGHENLRVGSRVGVLVDSSSDLHLYVNGQDQGVAGKHVVQPCFAVFDLFTKIYQVTALPTSRRT